VVSHHTVARDAAEVGMARLVGALAVIAPIIALVQVLANSRNYHQPAVAIAVWLGILGAAAWLVPRLRTGGLSRGEAVAAMAIAVAAVAVIGVMRRPHSAPGSVDLAILGTAWLICLAVMSCPPRVWIPGALLVYAVHGALLIRNVGLTKQVLSQLGAAAYIMAVILLVFAVLRPTAAAHASVAARRASLASRLAAERAAAAAIQQERQDRLAVLETEALPLLRGIADGTLDPASDGVRQECARHAAILRDSLTGRAPQAGELAAALLPTLRAARERGVLVTEQFIGDPGTPPPPAADAVVAMLDAVIGELAPQPAILTVLPSGDDVELYLIFEAPLRSMPDLTQFQPDLPASARWHAALVATEAGSPGRPGGAGGGSLELRWRKDGALDSGH
jgi:hypothetical protein